MKHWMFVAFLCIPFLSIAQWSEGFEVWNASGESVPFDWSSPQGWTTSNPVTEFIDASVEPSTDSYAGATSALVKSQMIFGTPHSGVLHWGTASFDYAQLMLVPSLQGNMLVGKPAAIRGWYKYLTSGDQCNALIKVQQIRFNNATGNATLLHETMHGFAEVEQYTPFEILLSWNEPFDALIHRLNITFYSQNDGCPFADATLHLDGLSMDFVSGTEDVDQLPVSFIVSPNPVRAGNDVHIMLDRKDVSLDGNAMLYHTYGGLVKELPYQLGINGISISTSGLSPGIYFLKVSGLQGFQKVVIYK